MKTILLVATSSLVLSTTLSFAEWINPSDKVCTKNGGRLAHTGICDSSWSDAKRICSAIGARLPTIGELKRVVIDCNVKINDDNNKNNPVYQLCYQNRGFSSFKGYWSSNTDVSNTGDVQILSFYYGGQYLNGKDKKYRGYVRCMKAK